MDLVGLMAISSADARKVTIEATVATGFESVAISEFRELFANNPETCKSRGRIYFNVTDSEINKVHAMRSIDNVFVVADAVSNMGFDAEHPENDLQLIREYAKKPDWAKVFAIWKTNAFFEGICYPSLDQYASSLEVEQELVDKARRIATETSKQSVINDATVNECDINDETVNESCDGNDVTVNESRGNDVTVNECDINDVTVNECDINDVTVNESSAINDATVNECDNNDVTVNESCDDTADARTTRPDNERSKRTNGRPASEASRRRAEREQARVNALVIRVYNELDDRPANAKVLKYRVTCIRRGKNSFGSQDAATRFGGQLQDSFQWIVDLERFDLEIFLNIRSEHVYASVALTTESKHHRNIRYFGPTTLRATVCYNLVRLAEPRPGDVIVDPLCGGGSIPIEGSLGWRGTYHLGGDTNHKAVLRAAANLRDVRPSPASRVDVLYWDATNLPLRDASVDIFVSDLPFGRRSGSKLDNRVLYVRVLKELARVARCPRGKAVLLTEDRRSFMKAVPQVRDVWKLSQTLCVNIGGLEAAVYLLTRTKNHT